MSEDFGRIASALERIADSLEKKWHIDIDHGHIEKIDNIEHGDIDTLYDYDVLGLFYLIPL